MTPKREANTREASALIVYAKINKYREAAHNGKALSAAHKQHK